MRAPASSRSRTPMQDAGIVEIGWKAVCLRMLESTIVLILAQADIQFRVTHDRRREFVRKRRSPHRACRGQAKYERARPAL